MSQTAPDKFHNPVPLPDDKVPWLHLLEVGGDGTIAQGDPKFYYISTLVRAQREMSAARERSGTQMIVPMLAAFAILDQIGECYGFSDTMVGEPPATAPIKRALHHFPLPSGPLSSDQVQALYMMRNGLMHDAAYSSEERGGQKRHMIFRHDLTMEQVVTLPTRIWNGEPEDVCQQTITWVNPDLVIWIATTAIGRCGQALKLQDPKFKIRLDPQRIAAKYLLWHRELPRREPGDDDDMFGAGRAKDRRDVRDRLTTAEVEWHQKRYYPE